LVIATFENSSLLPKQQVLADYQTTQAASNYYKIIKSEE